MLFETNLLIHNNETVWQYVMCKIIGQLVQEWKKPIVTKTMFFLKLSNIPRDDALALGKWNFVQHDFVQREDRKSVVRN